MWWLTSFQCKKQELCHSANGAEVLEQEAGIAQVLFGFPKEKEKMNSILVPGVCKHSISLRAALYCPIFIILSCSFFTHSIDV